MQVYLPEVRLRAGILNITSQYITASTTQLYQFIGQCRSRDILSLIIEETHGVWRRYKLIKQNTECKGFTYPNAYTYIPPQVFK
jgi:hypothetical protein